MIDKSVEVIALKAEVSLCDWKSLMDLASVYDDGEIEDFV